MVFTSVLLKVLYLVAVDLSCKMTKETELDMANHIPGNGMPYAN